MSQHSHRYWHSPQSAPPHPGPHRGSQEILIGDAGVHLVMSRLLAWRIPVREAMNGQSYDIIADVKEVGLLRLQVKTTTRIRHGKLRFRMQRGFYHSRRGKFDYEKSDYDIAAFVHLSNDTLIFWASPPRNVAFPPEWLEPPSIEYKSWLLALRHREAAISRQAARSPPATAARPTTGSDSSDSPAAPNVPGNGREPSPPHQDEFSAGPRRTFFSSDESFE